MKTIKVNLLLYLLITSLGINIMANNFQSDTLITKSIVWMEDAENSDSLSGDRIVTTVDEKGDTTYFRLGKKKIEIIDGEDETSLTIEKNDENDDYQLPNDEYDTKPYTKNGWKDFKGHWAGFEFGLNNYVDNNFSLMRTPETENYDINTGKSWNYNLNFAQYSAGLGSDKLGLTTGLGVEWNNYHFAGDSTVSKENGSLVFIGIPNNTIKNRLQTTYLTIPILFEFQFGGDSRSDRAYVSAGIIGGIKMFSNVKIKYNDSGSKRKYKDKNDFYLTPLRYGLTLRVGYKAVKLYANYYLSSLFLENRAPVLYPVAMGLAITF